MCTKKRPFIVEFLGTPEAGKTTAIYTVANMLRNREKLQVLELGESAESLPDEFQKGSFDANMWMHFITQAGILKAIHSNVDIALVDRGYVDSSFYGYKFLKEGVCTQEEYEAFNKTFLKSLKPDLLVALNVSPQIAVKRRGGEGHLVNCEYIKAYNELFAEFFAQIDLDKEFVKTDLMDVYEMNEEIFNIIVQKFSLSKEK